MAEKKKTSTFRKITQVMVWTMIILTLAGVVLTTLVQLGVL